VQYNASVRQPMSRNLGEFPIHLDSRVGSTVKLTTVGAPTPRVTETTVTRAGAPEVLEYKWGDLGDEPVLTPELRFYQRMLAAVSRKVRQV
jgi:hypothetical protein